MSRQTAHKGGRHKRHPSNLIPAVSDYESDAANLQKNHQQQQQNYEPPPPRTNTELNAAVLQRYIPSIHSILSIAANAVVYTFDSTAESWDKSGVEGTLFVCSQAPLPHDATNAPRACVFVLNRRGLGNVIVDLARVSHVEIAGELIIFRVEGGGGGVASEGGEGNGSSGERVLGLWIHNDREETREVNGATIQECWAVARAGATAGEGVEEDLKQEAGPAMQAIGRPLTLNELFGSQGVVNQGQ